jgi:hypothetical protein
MAEPMLRTWPADPGPPELDSQQAGELLGLGSIPVSPKPGLLGSFNSLGIWLAR